MISQNDFRPFMRQIPLFFVLVTTMAVSPALAQSHGGGGHGGGHSSSGPGTEHSSDHTDHDSSHEPGGHADTDHSTHDGTEGGKGRRGEVREPGYGSGLGGSQMEDRIFHAPGGREAVSGEGLQRLNAARALAAPGVDLDEMLVSGEEGSPVAQIGLYQRAMQADEPDLQSAAVHLGNAATGEVTPDVVDRVNRILGLEVGSGEAATIAQGAEATRQTKSSHEDHDHDTPDDGAHESDQHDPEGHEQDDHDPGDQAAAGDPGN